MRGVRRPERRNPLRQRRPAGAALSPRLFPFPASPRRPSPALSFRGLRGPRGSRGGRRVRSGRCGGAGAGRGAAEELPSRRGGGGRREEAARLGSARGPRCARGGLGRPAVGSGFAPTGAAVRCGGGTGPLRQRAAEPRCYPGAEAAAQGCARSAPCAVRPQNLHSEPPWAHPAGLIAASRGMAGAVAPRSCTRPPEVHRPTC